VAAINIDNKAALTDVTIRSYLDFTISSFFHYLSLSKYILLFATRSGIKEESGSLVLMRESIVNFNF